MPLKRLEKCRRAYEELTKPVEKSKVVDLPKQATSLMADFNKRVKDFLYLHGLDENDAVHVEYAIDRVTEVKIGTSKQED